MIVSDHKRIIETEDNVNLDGIIGWCDTTGSFILYVSSLNNLPVISEHEVKANEQWDNL